MTAQYPYSTPLLANPQRRFLQNASYPYPQLTQNLATHGVHLSSTHESYQFGEVEGQESSNEATMKSEPVLPPIEGFPDIDEFDNLIKG